MSLHGWYRPILPERACAACKQRADAARPNHRGVAVVEAAGNRHRCRGFGDTRRRVGRSRTPRSSSSTRTRTRPPEGIVARNERIADDEITWSTEIRVATVARTAFDLGRYQPRDRAIARMDALMRAAPFSSEEVLLLAKRYRGARGVKRLKDALPLVDGGAASPRETWLRIALHRRRATEADDPDTHIRHRRYVAANGRYGLGGFQGASPNTTAISTVRIVRNTSRTYG